MTAVRSFQVLRVVSEENFFFLLFFFLCKDSEGCFICAIRYIACFAVLSALACLSRMAWAERR